MGKDIRTIRDRLSAAFRRAAAGKVAGKVATRAAGDGRPAERAATPAVRLGPALTRRLAAAGDAATAADAPGGIDIRT
ncbi:hypothetical protein [Azospirillum sp. ST 5-10]|uniref:hypothetical protein n=1 Tax=unclassified Azospirillum TaxID=2630922 RepID=UPI003F4A4458